MKKTKLLTSLAALALVLGLGACGETQEDVTTGDEGGSTDSEPTAYALVGDFTDSSWNESPATSSKYYISAGTTHYEVEVELPTADELGSEPAFRVVEYGTWNLVAGYESLDVKNSTGVTGANGSEGNIGLEGGKYNITLELGETKSILVIQDTEVYTTTSSSVADAIALVEENGAAVDSWTGIDGRWDYAFDVYQDLSYEGGEGYEHDEDYSYSEVYLTQAVLTDDGFTALWDITDTYSYGDFTYAMFFVGDDLYLNYFGYIELEEGLGAYYDFDEFFDDLVDLIEGEDNVLIDFEELAEEEGIEVTGEVATSDRGNTRSSLALHGEYDVEFEYWVGGPVSYGEETAELGLEVIYDADGELASFTYSYYCLDIWDDGEIDIEEQTITYVPFDGEVATPDWVLSYNA